MGNRMAFIDDLVTVGGEREETVVKLCFRVMDWGDISFLVGIGRINKHCTLLLDAWCSGWEGWYAAWDGDCDGVLCVLPGGRFPGVNRPVFGDEIHLIHSTNFFARWTFLQHLTLFSMLHVYVSNELSS